MPVSAGPIGVAANPASGKDVRRLVARASVFDNQEKRAIVKRAVVGALAAGAREFLYVPDTHGIAQQALAELGEPISAKPVDAPRTGSALDTVRGASALRDAGCAVAITLGGDGTNRAFVKGWPAAPLMPISTGTNNVFPRLVEATVAGSAAGLVASGALALEDVATQRKRISVEIEDEPEDLALIDAVVTSERFVGARALLDSARLRLVLLTRADPASVGMAALGGFVQPLADSESSALLLELGSEGERVRAPIAPGLYQEFAISSARTVPFGEVVRVTGPCVLAFDGERERPLQPGQRALLRVERDGPHVIDVDRALRRAACLGLFRLAESGGRYAD